MSIKVSPRVGRLREKDGSLNVSFGSVESRKFSSKGKDFHVFAGHSSDDKSFDEDFDIPKVKTSRAQRMEGEIGLNKSTHVKYPIKRLNYDSFIAHHCAYIAKVIQVQKPSCFEEANRML